MKSEYAKFPTVDREFLKRYDELDEPGRPRLADEIISRFLRSVPDWANKVELAIESRNSDALRREAHGLIGTSGNVGAKRLAEIARELEELAEAGSWEGVAPLLADLLQEVEGVRAEFRTR